VIGQTLGPYQVLSKLGEGGMGEVYRARDTKLDRDVALKILPESFAAEPDRLMRFEREAKTLAALNHPNIAAIYGIEEADGVRALVMELVEGEDLSAIIHGGRGLEPPAASPGSEDPGLPLQDALAIARQIIDALQAAHDAGIIHRDLKPANIKVRADGTVKVLDFGLAKGVEGVGSRSRGQDPTPSTMTSPAMTEMGRILGTAAYMAPEQAKGGAIDKRADIWAFGVVLFEMLGGRRLFAGDSITETLADVLKTEIDFTALPAGVPPAIHRLLRRCLERNPANRLRDIGDARFDLTDGEAEARSGPAPSAPSGPARRWYRQPLTVPLAAVAVLSVSAAVWSLAGRAPVAVPTHLSIALPYGHSLASGPAISRNGREVAFVSTDGTARPQLYVRRLDEPASHAIAGAEDAEQPFFSPDGRWVAFYAKGGLFKVSLEGGAPVRLADSNSHNGGTWMDDGRIVFNQSWNGGLYAVSENGGDAVRLIEPKPPHEYADVWPYALPGSRELLFSRWGDTFTIVRLDLRTMTQTPVVAPGWRKAEYAAPGYVVFGSNDAGELWAAPYAGASQATGPVAVVEHVDVGGLEGGSAFDISANGTLAYGSADRQHRTLSVVDASGHATPTKAGDRGYSVVRLSPDGRRAAVIDQGVLKIVDLDRGTVTPLVPELGSSGAEDSPVWSPDGSRVLFSSNHEGNWDIYAKPASGVGGIKAVLRRPFDQNPLSSAPDGALLFEEDRPDTGMDVWMVPPPGGDPQPWLVTHAEEGEARFSPDGRLVAYVSNASSRSEVYVQTRATNGQRIQVSVDGGEHPAWSPAGDRLYFRQGNAMMAAAIDTRHGLSAGVPEQLFNGGWALAGSFDFEVMPDGKRFLMIRQEPDAIATRIDVVLNWFQDLRQRLQRQ
jgi:eukaryotic-like serine/threonine-protein kinase